MSSSRLGTLANVIEHHAEWAIPWSQDGATTEYTDDHGWWTQLFPVERLNDDGRTAVLCAAGLWWEALDSRN